MELKGLAQWADYRKAGSLANRFRLKRMDFFRGLLDSLQKPINILDVGGTETFWETMGFVSDPDYKITLLNLVKIETHYPNLQSVVGDVRNLKNYTRGQFDLVFSNSVIEHVGGLDGQRRMAEELKRVGKRYFLQTPNLYFPIEPHFLFPFFQFLPLGWRVFLIGHFDLGWHRRTKDDNEARALADSVHLLSKRDLKSLFPQAIFVEEKILGLTKSFIIFEGFIQH